MKGQSVTRQGLDAAALLLVVVKSSSLRGLLSNIEAAT